MSRPAPMMFWAGCRRLCPRGGLQPKIFAVRPMVVVGEATYCLYLLHFNCINLMNKYHVALRLHMMPIEPWFSYSVAVLLALAAYYGVENPVRRWILKTWGHKR